MFVEAILPYFSFQISLEKQQEKIIKEMKNMDPDRVIFAPIENIQKAFQTYFGDELTYKLIFDPVKVAYLKKMKQAETAGMEIDQQTFFKVMASMHMRLADKKLLRAIILLSFCGEQRKYEEIDQIIQQELRDYNPDSSNLELYKVESVKIKRLTLKTFPEIESDWETKIGNNIEPYL